MRVRSSPFGEVRNGQYVVAPGDTVAIVSERTNTPIRTLIDLNRLAPPYVLKAGQRLNLQPRGSHIVQKGDTISGIAARQGVSISALIQLNNLREPYTLQIGQNLVLPTSALAGRMKQAEKRMPGTIWKPLRSTSRVERDFSARSRFLKNSASAEVA